MLQEMAALGFEQVELSHGIRVTLVPGILRAVDAGVVKVTSVHNFCPLPPGALHAAPNLYEPSASDPGERAQWLRYTKRSLEFAAQVKAGVLVCHLGRVRFRWFDPARRIARYLERAPGAGRTPGDPGYAAVLRRSQARLARHLTPYWDRARACLAEAVPHAVQAGVKLGIENRDGFDELPRDGDLEEFFSADGAEAPVGYWHDTGHAEIKAAMGVIRPAEQLAALASHTLGFHLHDVSAGGRDHQPIGAGTIDFPALAASWRSGHLLTLELGPRTTPDEVRASKARIEALLT